MLYPGSIQKELGYAPWASSAREQLAVILKALGALGSGANDRDQKIGDLHMFDSLPGLR